MDRFSESLTVLLGYPFALVAAAVGAIVAVRLLIYIARTMRDDMRTMIDDAAAARFEIGVREDDPETDYIIEIEADMAKLIDADRWDLVHGLLAAWEKDAAKTPFGTLFHQIGAEVALTPLFDISEAADATGVRPPTALISKRVAEFEARMASEPDNHVAGALAARAHIAAGWAIRGDGWIEEVPAAELRRMAEHYRAAERILSGYAAQGSSLVAEARYFVCLGLDNGHELIRSRYEAWIATDPDSIAPFQVHGFHLLPRWYGDLEELEAEARRAAEATQPTRGAAGYAIFHGGVMACGAGDETLPGIDPALFVRAALDRARTAGSQWGVNRMGEFLLRAMLESRGDAQAVYREGLTALVRDHLRVLVPAAWSSPIDDVRWELARLFKKELEAGARVRVDARGIAVLPAETGGTVPA